MDESRRGEVLFAQSVQWMRGALMETSGVAYRAYCSIPTQWGMLIDMSQRGTPIEPSGKRLSRLASGG